MNLTKNILMISNFLHGHSLAFVYERYLKEALYNFLSRRNSHRTRPSRTAGCPPGMPNDLYLLPRLSGKCYNIYCLCMSVSFLMTGRHSKLQEEATRRALILMCGPIGTEYARRPHPFFPDEF